MSWLVVSYYTSGTDYEKESKNLLASVDKFNIPCKIYVKENLGSWSKNCQQKSLVIKEAMLEFPDKNCIWTDCDSVFFSFPTHFDKIFSDVAYYYLPSRKEVLSGTVFFRNNEKVRHLIDRWIEVNKTNDAWDQKNLERVLGENKSIVSQELLPLAYCYVFDARFSEKLDNPVIVHYQASRRLKNKIGK